MNISVQKLRFEWVDLKGSLTMTDFVERNSGNKKLFIYPPPIYEQ